MNEARKTPVPVTLELYKLSEVAVMFGVSQRTVATWIRSGELRALRLGRRGRLLRLRRTDLEAFLESNCIFATGAEDGDADDPFFGLLRSEIGFDETADDFADDGRHPPPAP
ncbi:MAG: helix-turn-helix domain-containing protein [Caldilineales bacterium]|nr:helix-turn-helix domain-containing protein [Caldilineales bacterium]